MFEFLTKEGRARFAEKKRIRIQQERGQQVARERQDYEQRLSSYSKFNQAYYWFDLSDLTKYHLYSSKEIIDLDVYYLGQMIEALDDGVEKIDISMLTEKSPTQVFSSRFSNFMKGMLDVLCGYEKPSLFFSKEQLQDANKNYASVLPEERNNRCVEGVWLCR